MVTTRELHELDNILLNTTIKLIKRRATHNLQNLLNKTHVADIARIIHGLRPEERPAVYELLADADKAAGVLKELSAEDRLGFIDSMKEERLAKVLQVMAPDDFNDLLVDFPDEKAEYLLQFVKGAPSEDLLQYEEKTAGYIMTPHFFALPEDTTAEYATQKIRELIDVEMVFYVYVVDDLGKLKGVVSLRQLVATRPQTPLRDLMTTKIYSVNTFTEQEEVARMVTRYNLLAVPVLDEDGILVGIVTVDDVIDVIREENTEDMLKLSGTGEVALESKSVWKNLRARAPWLSVSWIGGLIAVLILYYLSADLTQWILLAAFLPIIMGMAGNVGTQSATITVRGLATGEIQLKEIWRLLLRELGVGAFLGIFSGLLLAGFTWLFFPGVTLLPIVVAFAICANIICAAAVGTLVPMLFQRLRWDPAIATGPFLTTVIDIIGVLDYLLIARILL